MQTFTKRLINFEQIKIFELFKKHRKIWEAFFYGKNHELDMTLKLADAASGRGRVDSEACSPFSRLAATWRLWLVRYCMGRYDSRHAAYRNP